MPSRAAEDPTVLGREGLDLLLEITVLLGADMASYLRERGLTEARVPVLWALGDLGPSTQRVLADRIGVSPRNITGLVDALAETGFVVRAAHPTDARAFLVTLTRDGEAEVELLRGAREQLSVELFGDLMPERLADLVADLENVVGKLRAPGAEPSSGAGSAARSSAATPGWPPPIRRTP